MRTSLLAALFAAISLPLTSCGGGDSAATPLELYKSAAAAYQSGEHADAVQSLNAALDGMGDDTSGLKDMQVLLAKAQAHLDPEKARSAFQDFAAEHADLVGADDFADVANALMDAETGLSSAATLVADAKKAFPEQASLFDGADALIQERIAAGELSDDEREVLEGLGYITQ